MLKAASVYSGKITSGCVVGSAEGVEDGGSGTVGDAVVFVGDAVAVAIVGGGVVPKVGVSVASSVGDKVVGALVIAPGTEVGPVGAEVSAMVVGVAVALVCVAVGVSVGGAVSMTSISSSSEVGARVTEIIVSVTSVVLTIAASSEGSDPDPNKSNNSWLSLIRVGGEVGFLDPGLCVGAVVQGIILLSVGGAVNITSGAAVPSIFLTIK